MKINSFVCGMMNSIVMNEGRRDDLEVISWLEWVVRIKKMDILACMYSLHHFKRH